MPDFKCQPKNGPEFYVEVKSLDVVGGNPRQEEMLLDGVQSHFDRKDQFIGKSDHVGARDFRALLVGYVVVLNRAQYLPLCPTDLFDRFVRVTVDNNGQSGIRRFKAREGARFCKFLLPLFGLGRGSLLPIERPIFSMNDLASSLDEELSPVSCRAIASLAWYDGSHLGRLHYRYCMGIFGTAPQYRTH